MKMANRILVVGITKGTTADELSDFFTNKAGQVESLIFLEGDERALVNFDDKTAMEKALGLTGRSLKGGVLNIEKHLEKDVKSDVNAEEDSASKIGGDLLNLVDSMSTEIKTKLLLKLQSDELETEDLHTSGTVHDPNINLLGTASAVPLVGSGGNSLQFVKTETPKLPMFSGDVKTKGESTYSQWRYDLMSLKKDPTWSSSLVLQAVRRSTKGMASTLLQSLGLSVTVDQVLEEFDVNFGNFLCGEDLVQECYNAQQTETETIVEWSCRLKDLIYQAEQKATLVNSATRLRHQFWVGLSSTYIQSGIRHLFDAGEPYSKLLLAARTLERKQDQTSKKQVTRNPQQQQLTVDKSPKDKSDQILQEIKALKERIGKLEKGKESRKGSCYECGSEDHYRNKCPNRKKTSGQAGNKADRDKNQGN